MELQNQPKQELPNASLILILGIASIVGCCLSYGFIGLICSIIALILAKSANELYVQNPDYYTESSYKNMITGKTCAKVSLILSIILIVVGIFLVTFVGTAAIFGFFNSL